MGIESPVHLLFIGIVALVVLGPKRLPELARRLGDGVREFREAIDAGADQHEAQHQQAQAQPPAGAPAAAPRAAASARRRRERDSDPGGDRDDRDTPAGGRRHDHGAPAPAARRPRRATPAGLTGGRDTVARCA